MQIRSAGQAALALVMLVLGLQGLYTGQFTAVWQPVPATVPGREALIYLCAVVSLGAGFGLLWRRTAAVAARALFVLLLAWVLLFRVRSILRAPAVFGTWDGCAETTAMLAAAWVLYVWFAGDRDVSRVGLVAGPTGLRAAQVLYGLALVSFGVAHFIYPQQTAALVPRWLPAHLVWVYLAGTAFLAAAIAVLTGVWARLAAALSALQIGLFTLLVWVPIVARGSKDPSDWSEFAISAALTTAGWVVADSYQGASGRHAREGRAGIGPSIER